MATSASSKSNSNNDDIYINNGNVDLKVKPISDKTMKLIEDCQKVDAETERGASLEK